MATQENFKGQEAWKCNDCGLHYESKELAESCQAFCTKHGACSMEIIKQSIEQRQQ